MLNTECCAADIGLVFRGNLYGAELTYARVGGVAYGKSSNVEQLAAPVLLDPPEDGINATAAFFAWSQSPGATGYRFQISRDSTRFGDIAVDTVVVDTTFYDDIFEPDGWYHWRVGAMDSAEVSAWSSVGRFYLKFPVAVEESAEVGEGLVVEGVYPNPASSSVSIELRLAAPSDVRVEMFDVVGRRVLSADYGPLAAGKQTVVVAGLDLPSGYYTLRCVTDAGTAGAGVIVRR